MFHLLGLTKGLIKPKAVWARRRFVLFAVKSKKANKTNSFVHFSGESTARPNCFWFYHAFSKA